MIFHRISELMLATLIQRYDNKCHFISRTRDQLKFYRTSGATFYDCINTIYQFIKPFLEIKMSILEEYGAFKILNTFLVTRLSLALKKQEIQTYLNGSSHGNSTALS